MNYAHLLFPCFLLVCSFHLNGQKTFPTQTLRGEIKDANTGDLLTGATAEIELNEMPKGAVADQNGQFRFDSIPVGRYRLQVKFLGYKTAIIPEISVESGKEFIQNIWLEKSSESLQEAVVTGIGRSNRRVQSLSSHTLTVKETFRFPATFNDPVRLAMSYPGVVGTNDQANGISIRGNSPASMQWRLEGVEIVNPNHLSNAGTANDQATSFGGGVNILSAQMLSTSTLHKGNFPIEYGNALGGIMDMNFRNGNDEKREFTVKTGLLGLEFATEGPFSKKSKASYLLNYRYSFVGVLASLGVDFGGEKISFQDLSFQVNLPTKKAGTFSIFGMGGNSKNIFEKQDSVKEEKDLLNIRFDSEMAAVGLKHQKSFKNAFWSSTLVASGSFHERMSDVAIRQDSVILNRNLSFSNQQKLSFLTKIDHAFSKHKIQYGFSVNWQSTNLQMQDFDSNILPLKVETDLIRPFINWSSSISTKLNFTVGAGLSYFLESNTLLTEPNFELNYQIDARQKVSFKSSLHSQYFFNELFGSYGMGDNFFPNPQPSRTWHSGVGYERKNNSGTIFQSEIYYQKLFELPISDRPASAYSTANHIGGSDWTTSNLISEGTATNIGLDLSLQKYLTKKLYFLASGSLYNSSYRAGDDVARSTRFNGNYALNFTGGKEFHKRKKSKLRIFGVNLRAVLAGGMRVTPITSRTPPDPNSPDAFSQQLNDYFRTDLRVYFKWNRSNRTSVLAIDIQNLTNRKNEAYFYHDLVKDDVVLKNQLGLIPNLSYQLDF